MKPDQAFVKPIRREFVFKDSNNRITGKVKTAEIGGGGKHFGRSQPNGPQCGQPLRVDREGKAISLCPEKWAPVCPNRDCPGNTVPRRIMRIERYGFKTREQQERRTP